MKIYQNYIYPILMKNLLSKPSIEEKKKKIMAKAYGSVLEVGIGHWSNLQYYDSSKVSKLTGVEASLAMKKFHVGLHTDIPIEIIYDFIENVHLKNETYDTVVSTFSLCSVANLGLFVDKITMALKPNGIVLFLEHGISSNKTKAAFQKIYNKIQKPFAQGCSIINDYDEILNQNLLQITKNERYIESSMPLFTKEIYYMEGRKV
jgi:SAM-dependent methyltransferase